MRKRRAAAASSHGGLRSSLSALVVLYAAGVSMGLLGIISEVTFQCEDAYDVEGREVTAKVDRSPVDLFADGALEKWLRDAEYNRLLWWPQHGVDTVQLWEATRAPAGGARRPFVSATRAQQAILRVYFEALAFDSPPYAPHTQRIIQLIHNAALDLGTKTFRDTWHQGLPMDNQISDGLMPTEFTELFIDIRRTGEVMRELRDFFAGDRDMDRTGAYAIEIYPAPASRFWMSPSYGMDTVRVDVFWFTTEVGDPVTDFYPQYWKLLEKYDFRFHWGKHLSPPGSSTGVEYRRRSLPRWDDFLAARRRLDPKGVFLTDYWRAHLGIA